MTIVPDDLRGQDFEVTEIGIIFWLWKNKLALKNVVLSILGECG
jgi:hypothetical protein